MDRAASSAEHFAHGSRDARWTPPDQYGLVESQVYRSAFLTPASFDFINLLNLRTVVNLSQEVPVRAVLSFFQENHITLENVGLQVWTSMAFAPITQELIKEALQHVLDVSRHPLLLMSSSGTHQDQLSLPLRPPAWWEEEQQMLHADLAAWEALRDQAAGTASKTSPGLRRPASEGNQLSEARQYRRPDPRSGPGREYFRVSGPLASPGTITSMVDEDED